MSEESKPIAPGGASEALLREALGKGYLREAKLIDDLNRARASLSTAEKENTRLQEEAALYKQRYQEKAAESQTWAAKAGAHAAENTPLKEALRVAVQSFEENLAQAREGLDSTRNVIGAIAEASYWSGRRGAFEYAIEKLRCETDAPAVTGTRSDNTSLRQPAGAALAANKASEIASDSSALEKALGALRAADSLIAAMEEAALEVACPTCDQKVKVNADGTLDHDEVPPCASEGARWRAALEGILTALSGGAHVDALKAQKDPADLADPEPR